jgi:penicillin-binding protein 1A
MDLIPRLRRRWRAISSRGSHRTGDAGERWRRRLRVLFVAALVCAVFGFSLLAYFAYTLPLSDDFGAPDRKTAMTVLAANGEIVAMRGKFATQIVDINDLPPHLVDAVVAIEDRRFRSHAGIDPLGMARAAWVNLKAGEIRQGGSTITQQLAKLMFLSPERTFKRKIQEAMIAMWLENRLTKDEILTRYLNKVYLGAGAHGVSGAASRYFNKPAKDLTLAESAMLAGLIRAPSYLAPTRNLLAARSRAKLVLKAMVDTGRVDAETAAAAEVDSVTLAVDPNAEATVGAGYFADWVASRSQELLGPMSADLTIETTLNPGLQRLAEHTLAKWLDGEGARRNVGQGAMLVMSQDGGILAMVGGRNYEESQFNRVVQARRQPGSLFKLFVYLAAFDAGLTPDTVFIDQPIAIGKWRPQNYHDTYVGEVTLRRAFAESINSVAVQLTERIGRKRVIGVARRLGVDSPLKSHPSLALGASEVTLMEMTGAYAAMAADVKRVRPYAIRSIRGNGSALYRHRGRHIRQSEAMLPWRRNEMLDLLIATVDNGTGRAARMSAPVAGKTGTTQDYRDAWYIGFTADLVVGIWLGNDDNSPMDRVSGGDLPAKIWRDFIAAVYRSEGDAPGGSKLLAGIPKIPTRQVEATTEETTGTGPLKKLRDWLFSIVE